MKHCTYAILAAAALYIPSYSFEFRYNRDVYATHQPVLYEMVKNTQGPVVEFGCGHGSTDLLHELCASTKRLLISIDNDKEWLNKFKNKYAKDADWHKFYSLPRDLSNVESPELWIQFLVNTFLPEYKDVHFSVCFIDQAPWLGRHETLKRLLHMSDYVIIHDCDYFAKNNIFGTISYNNLPRFSKYRLDFSDVFTYWKAYYSPYGPPTVVGSLYSAEIPEIDMSK